MLLQMKSTNEAGRDNPGKSWQIVASNRLEQFRTCWNSLYQPQFAATLRDARRRSITQALRQPALHGIGWAKACSLRSAAPRFCPFEAPPGFEHAGDRPRLRRTAARGVRRVIVEDLADLAETAIEKMIANRPVGRFFGQRRIAGARTRGNSKGASGSSTSWVPAVAQAR